MTETKAPTPTPWLKEHDDIASSTAAPLSPIKKKVTSLRRMVRGARKVMEQREQGPATDKLKPRKDGSNHKGSSHHTRSTTTTAPPSPSKGLHAIKKAGSEHSAPPSRHGDPKEAKTRVGVERSQSCGNAMLNHLVSKGPLSGSNHDNTMGSSRHSLSRSSTKNSSHKGKPSSAHGRVSRQNGHGKLRESLPFHVANRGDFPHYSGHDYDHDDDESSSSSSSVDSFGLRKDGKDDDDVSLGSVESAISTKNSTALSVSTTPTLTTASMNIMVDRGGVPRQSSWASLHTSGGSDKFPTIGGSTLNNSGTFHSSVSSWGTLNASGNSLSSILISTSSLAMPQSGVATSSSGISSSRAAGPTKAFINTGAVVALHNSGSLNHSGNLSGSSWGALGASAGSNSFANVRSTLGLNNGAETDAIPLQQDRVGSLEGLSILAREALAGNATSAASSGHLRRSAASSTCSSHSSSMNSWGAMSSTGNVANVPPSSVSLRTSVSSWGTLDHSMGSGTFPSTSAMSSLKL